MHSRVSVIGVWVSVLIGAFSLVTMVAALQIDNIVNRDLYSYGLQLNYQWALPYWTAIRSIFAVSWMAMITAIGLQVFLLVRKKEKFEGPNEAELRNEKLRHKYRLSDGAVIEVKHNVKNIKRLDEFSADGMPMYVVESEDAVQVVSVPEKLRKKSV